MATLKTLKPRLATLLVVLSLAACGGGNKAPAEAGTQASPAPVDAAPMPKPAPETVLQMPPPGDPLWAIPPDRSPLWQLVGPDPNAKPNGVE
jgi:hypothetical protein